MCLVSSKKFFLACPAGMIDGKLGTARNARLICLAI
jgi:hypothetical protein